MFSTYIHLLYFFYIVARSIAYPIDRSSSGDNSGHLAPFHNQGAPLYFDTGHQHHQSDFEDYPAGYDGYASYAPHHDHEHYHYPKYKFEYGVHDPHTGDIKKQYEERDGDVVRGYYSLVEPDGWIRIVEYTADAKHGFQAKVHRIPPHPPHHHPPVHHTPPYYNDYPPHHDDDDDGHYYPPVHNPNGYYGENDYGSYNVYESEETRYPPAPVPEPYNGDYGSKIRTHDNPDGPEYENSVEDYPFHSNVPYPAYAPPPQSYPSVQDLTSYSSQGDVENPDKLFDKRSPLKRLLKQPITVLQMEEKKDDNVTEATKDAKLAATTTTNSSSTLQPNNSKVKDTKSSSTTGSPSTTNKSQHRTSTEITKSSTEKTTPKSGDAKIKKS